MRKPQKDLSQEQLEPLRHQIQEWRKARKGPGPMPEELWSGAVILAKAFGVCPIARALPLDYTAQAGREAPRNRPVEAHLRPVASNHGAGGTAAHHDRDLGP